MMDVIGMVHTACAVAALVSGCGVVALSKGTVRHRQVGRCYVASMLLLNLSALAIYDLFGGVGPFHVAAIVSLATLIAGFVPVYIRRPRRSWLALHSRFMAWSVVGLVAAAVAEAIVRLPGADFAWAVGASTLAVTLIGGCVIHVYVPHAARTLVLARPSWEAPARVPALPTSTAARRVAP